MTALPAREYLVAAALEGRNAIGIELNEDVKLFRNGAVDPRMRRAPPRHPVMTALREEVARTIAHAMTGGHPSKPKLIDYSAADAVIPIILGRAAEVADGWETHAAGDDYMTDGRRFWDAGNVYDQARADTAAAIRQIGRPE